MLGCQRHWAVPCTACRCHSFSKLFPYPKIAIASSSELTMIAKCRGPLPRTGGAALRRPLRCSLISLTIASGFRFRCSNSSCDVILLKVGCIGRECVNIQDEHSSGSWRRVGCVPAVDIVDVELCFDVAVLGAHGVDPLNQSGRRE